MAKETKVGLLIGLALILLVGVILSDLVGGPAPVADVQDQAAGFGPQAQHNIYAPPPDTPAGHPHASDRPTVVDRDPGAAAVPDPFRAQPPFGQSAPASRTEADRTPAPVQLSPPPSRRPSLPENDTRQAAAPRVTDLPRAWRVDRPNPASAPVGLAPGRPAQPALARDPALSATPQDHSFFIPPPASQATATPIPNPGPGTDRFHIAGPRDSLAAVARKHYGDPAFATGLARANPLVVAGPGGTLAPGTRLALPPREDTVFTAPATAEVTPEPLPPTPPQRATADAPAGTVTVTAGDTLSGLAARHLGSGQRWDDLLAANPDVLDRPEALRAGMVLRLPAEPGASAPANPAPPAAAAAPPSATPATYTVKAGDNLTRIAARALGDGQRWDDLFAANRDQLDNPSQVRPGMVLILPPAAGAPSRPAASAPPKPAAAPAPNAPRTYTVKAGDNLTRIAARTLGDGQRWDDLFAANRDQLDAPEALREGQVLRLP